MTDFRWFPPLFSRIGNALFLYSSTLGKEFLIGVNYISSSELPRVRTRLLVKAIPMAKATTNAPPIITAIGALV